MKKMNRCLCAAALCALSALVPVTSQAWDKWDAFKAANVNDSYRVIDYNDNRRITTSEGQSYAMFFALVAGDKESFDNLLKWTENNLASGDITKHKPAWLWGKNGSSWGIIDSNNAADSDMWIAYCLLEAGRLWDRPDYTAKGKAMMDLLKKDVRDIKGLGKVLLPGYKGFEQTDFVTLNPSYYPVFILRRFELEDAEWKAVTEGTVRSLVRSAPRGYAPDWVRFNRQGKVIKEKGDDFVFGSYNAIRTYMWAAMMSPADPVRAVLVERFEPFAELARQTNMPPEKINVFTGERHGYGSPGFAACVLELLGKGATQNYLRTVIENDPIIGENYYRNTLMVYAIGFDRGLYRFDRNGYLILSPKIELTQVPPKAAAVVDETKEEQPEEQTEMRESPSTQDVQGNDAPKDTVKQVVNEGARRSETGSSENKAVTLLVTPTPAPGAASAELKPAQTVEQPAAAAPAAGMPALTVPSLPEGSSK